MTVAAAVALSCQPTAGAFAYLASRHPHVLAALRAPLILNHRSQSFPSRDEVRDNLCAKRSNVAENLLPHRHLAFPPRSRPARAAQPLCALPKASELAT